MKQYCPLTKGLSQKFVRVGIEKMEQKLMFEYDINQLREYATDFGGSPVMIKSYPK